MFAQSKGGNYSLTDGASGVADAIDFDGTNDYLSRSSDLTGNADGKTFTFSAWVWVTATSTKTLYSNNDQFGNEHGFTVEVSDNSLFIHGGSSAGSVYLRASISNCFAAPSFYHILISIDLTNSSNRYIYINDDSQSPNWTTYSNANIDFTRSVHSVSADPYSSFSSRLKGRLAHVFLAYEYIDLSVEANRRIFITADRKATSNANALWTSAGHTSAIMYLPLNDPTQPGKNLGTGGDFALNGVVARSGRGPSQFNAPYSNLDGSADYLSRTANLVGATDSKSVTVSFNFMDNGGLVNTPTFFWFGGASLALACLADETNVTFAGNNSAGTTIFQVHATKPKVAGRNYTVTLSFDLSDTAKRSVFINGEIPTTTTWVTYTNDSIPFSYASPRLRVGNSIGTSYFKGKIGNIFFDTRYIDLSQPANLAKFVTGTGIDAKPVDLGANGEKPFGTPPLIYLPMYGNNAGKNYGTGGDFTVNSGGPFVGARGPNEYWGNKADFDGSTGYLARTGAAISTSKTISGSFWFSPDNSGTNAYVFSLTNGTLLRFNIYRSAGSLLVIEGWDSSDVKILSFQTNSGSYTAGTSNFVQFHVDLTDTGKRGLYVNGAAVATTWNIYTNGTMSLDQPHVVFGGYYSSSVYTKNFDGKLSELYLTTYYIDFSQEANRLKFRDAFGNPVALLPQIEAGTLPNPAIYMRFDPTNFGKNSGTGGDFTVNGTITDGGQL